MEWWLPDGPDWLLLAEPNVLAGRQAARGRFPCAHSPRAAPTSVGRQSLVCGIRGGLSRARSDQMGLNQPGFNSFAYHRWQASSGSHESIWRKCQTLKARRCGGGEGLQAVRPAHQHRVHVLGVSKPPIQSRLCQAAHLVVVGCRLQATQHRGEAHKVTSWDNGWHQLTGICGASPVRSGTPPLVPCVPLVGR